MEPDLRDRGAQRAIASLIFDSTTTRGSLSSRIIEAEIHLEKRLKLFRQTEPPECSLLIDIQDNAVVFDISDKPES
ncbi:hypothetical protein RvVAR0630_pl05320 (plasmid) [Agrobacterium vitis]|nr:hypothetical protein RvVAR0630_pl05320 [Agrobacterium vitis]